MSVQKVDKTTGNTTLIAGATLWADSPIGTILPYGGATAPSGFLLCDGAEVLKTDYAELYAVIGDAFGTASVNTKFVLPDLRGEFLRGAGNNSHTNQGNGGSIGEHQDATEHNTAFINSARYGVFTRGNQEDKADSSISLSGSYTINSSYIGDTPSTNAGRYTSRPTNTSVNYIIKAKQVALPADLESAVEDAVEEVYGDIIPSDASSSNKVLVNSDKTSTVTSGSTAPITSGGVYEALANTLKYNSTVWNTSKSITINRSNALGHVYMISANGYWDNTDGSKYYVGIVKDPANNNTNPIITDLAKSSGITVSVTEKSANSLTLNFSGFSGEAVVTSVITIS